MKNMNVTNQRYILNGFSRLLALIIAITTLSLQAIAVGPGEALKDFTLKSNQGGDVALSNFKGKIVYLDIWASWCATCKQSLSWMHKMQEKFGNELQVIAVSVDSERADAEKALKESNAALLVGFDPEGKLPEQYNVSAMPTSFLIDRDGKIIAVNEGLSDKEKSEIEQRIEQQVKQQAKQGAKGI